MTTVDPVAMKKRTQVGWFAALACGVTAVVLVVTFADEIRIFHKLGTIPRLTIDRVYEEDFLEEVNRRVDLTLINPGSKSLHLAWPEIAHEVQLDGEWEFWATTRTDRGIQIIEPGESVPLMGVFLDDVREQRLSVHLSLSEEDEGVEIFSKTIRAPAGE